METPGGSTKIGSTQQENLAKKMENDKQVPSSKKFSLKRWSATNKGQLPHGHKFSQPPYARSSTPLTNSIFNFHRNRLFQSQLTAHGTGISSLSLGHIYGDRSARLLEVIAVEAVLLVPGQVPGRCQRPAATG